MLLKPTENKIGLFLKPTSDNSISLLLKAISGNDNSISLFLQSTPKNNNSICNVGG